jgi:hypothetical protein
VKEFSIIAKPVTKLTQKDVFDECENSFSTLKNSMLLFLLFFSQESVSQSTPMLL